MMAGVVRKPPEQCPIRPPARARRLSYLRATLLACLFLALTACANPGTCGLRECRDDAAISTTVRARLAQRPEFGSSEVSVQTYQGVVYLRGLVSTPYQISIAGEIAAAVPGVTSVQNLLAVENAH
jgi:hypothetical protein